MLHNKIAKRNIIVEPLQIRLAGYLEESVVDGPGLRCVIFTQGCPHNCPGCHNPATHSFDGGYMTDTAALWNKINANPMLQGITFSGGEPFMWGHELSIIGRAAHEKKLTVMTYSGYTFEELREKADKETGVKELLTVTDWLIDGPYIEAQRDLSLRFRGSKNQRILDITAYPLSDEATIIEN